MPSVLSLFSTTVVGGSLFLASSDFGGERVVVWNDYSEECNYVNKTPTSIVSTIIVVLPELRVLYQGSINSTNNYCHTLF